jgi:PIN domain nuclease of toxin-antitoxin system
VREWPVTGEVGMAAAALLEFHADPADRFITATALLYGATLVTADDQILAWLGTLQRHNARQ